MSVAGSFDLHVVATECDDDSTWDGFLAEQPGADYQQSGSWARVKAHQGWCSARMTVTRDGAIHGGAQLFYKTIPVVGAAGLIVRGPVLGSDDPALVALVAEGLERLATACNVMYLIVQPAPKRAELMEPQLLREGYRAAPRVLATHNTTGVLDLSQGEDAILAAMRTSTALRRGFSPPPASYSETAWPSWRAPGCCGWRSRRSTGSRCRRSSG